MSKGIMLLSGGLDSSLALIKLLEEGHTVTPLFVDYNQWSKEDEIDAVSNLINWIIKERPSLRLDIKDGCILSMTDNWPSLRLDQEDVAVGSVWGRGIALVGLAAMYAYTHGDNFDFIAVGNHKGDVGPDCKPGLFDNALGQALAFATKGSMELLLPIRDLSIEDIGIQLQERHIPFEILYSCYWENPCGYKSPNDRYLCPGCRRKAIAMRAAGVTDENILTFPNGNGDGRSYQSSKAERVDY